MLSMQQGLLWRKEGREAAREGGKEGARSSWTDGVASRRPITRTRRAVRHRNCSALWVLGMDLRAVWRCGLAAGRPDGRTDARADARTDGRTDGRAGRLACGPGPGYGKPGTRCQCWSSMAGTHPNRGKSIFQSSFWKKKLGSFKKLIQQNFFSGIN